MPEIPASTIGFGGGKASETYGAVYGSATSPRTPHVNLVLMFACDTMTTTNRHTAAIAFDIWDPGRPYYVKDRAYVGYGGMLRAGSVNKDLSDYTKAFMGLLAGGFTVQEVIKTLKDTPEYGWVQGAGLDGDPYTKLACVYLAGSETANVAAAWRTSWYYGADLQVPPPAAGGN